jgi:hypothetical protein
MSLFLYILPLLSCYFTNTESNPVIVGVFLLEVKIRIKNMQLHPPSVNRVKNTLLIFCSPGCSKPIPAIQCCRGIFQDLPKCEPKHLRIFARGLSRQSFVFLPPELFKDQCRIWCSIMDSLSERTFLPWPRGIFEVVLLVGVVHSFYFERF